MNSNLVLVLGLVAFSSAVSFSENKNILVNNHGTKIVVLNYDGKAVQIETDKISDHGNRLIQIQVTAPNRVTKTVKDYDQIVGGAGTTQSQVLAQIFKTHEGVTNENEYEEILNIISNQVQQGNVNQMVLVALQVLSEQNNDVQSQAALNQILEQEEQLQDVIHKQSKKNVEVDDAQQNTILQQQVELGQDLNGVNSLGNMLVRGQVQNVDQKKITKQQVLTRASIGKKTVLVSDDGANVVVINENGKAVKIQADQVGINGNRAIEIQVTAPQKATKTVNVNDEIVTSNGQTQSAVLAQIFSTFEGTLDQREFRDLVNVIADQVSSGNLHPAVLVALQVIDNDIFNAQKKLRQLVQVEEFENLSQQHALHHTLGGQGQFVGVRGQFGQQGVIEEVARQQAIDEVVNEQQKQQQVAQVLNQGSQLLGQGVGQIQNSRQMQQILGQQIGLGQLGYLGGKQAITNKIINQQLVAQALNQQRLGRMGAYGQNLLFQNPWNQQSLGQIFNQNNIANQQQLAQILNQQCGIVGCNQGLGWASGIYNRQYRNPRLIGQTGIQSGQNLLVQNQWNQQSLGQILNQNNNIVNKQQLAQILNQQCGVLGCNQGLGWSSGISNRQYRNPLLIGQTGIQSVLGGNILRKIQAQQMNW